MSNNSIHGRDSNLVIGDGVDGQLDVVVGVDETLGPLKVAFVLIELPLNPVDRVVMENILPVVEVQPLEVVGLGREVAVLVRLLLRVTELNVLVLLVVAIAADVAAVDAVGGLLLAEASPDPLQHFVEIFTKTLG